MLDDLPYPYSYFHSLQDRCRRAATARDYGWGLECALDYLVDAIATGGVPPEASELEIILKRKIGSGGRRQRSRQAALSQLPPTEEGAPDGAARARLEVRRIARLVSETDGAILADTAQGFTDGEIAERRGGTPGSVRTRLSRLRLKLAA